MDAAIAAASGLSGPLRKWSSHPANVNVTTTAEILIASVTIPDAVAATPYHIVASSSFIKDTGTTVRRNNLILKRATTELARSKTASSAVASTEYGAPTIPFIDTPGAGSVTYNLYATNIVTATTVATDIHLEVVELLGPKGDQGPQASARACRVFNSTNGAVLNVAAGGTYKGPIPFNAEDFDTHALHDVATNNSRIVLNQVGIWEVGWSVPWLISTGYTGGSDLEIAVVKNGTWGGSPQSLTSGAATVEDFESVSVDAGGTSVRPMHHGSTLVRATAITDFVELGAFCDVTGTAVHSLGAKYGLNFWAKFVGP